MTGRVDYDPAKHAGEGGVTVDASDIAREHSPERLAKAFDYGAIRRVTRGAAELGHLPLRFFSDLGPIAPPDKLVRKLLGSTTLAVIFGPPACGKTFLVTDLGMHIALGRAWFGRSVTPSSVIYVAGEGVAGIENRLAGFKAKHDLGEDVPFAFVPIAVNLGPSGADAQRVIDAAEAVEARTGIAVALIVIDTLARCIGSGDENSAQDMGQFLAACDRIRLSTGATVLVIHHVGKSAQAGARGSSALLGAVDTAIEVEKLDGGRVARVVKQKDGQEGTEIGFDLEVVEIGQDDEGEPITTCIVRPTTDIAKARPKLTPTERRALDVLFNVLVDHGRPPPNRVTFPNVTVVEIARFREGLKSAGVTDRDEQKMSGRSGSGSRMVLQTKEFLSCTTSTVGP